MRELSEEAGYTAREWTHLGVIHPLLSYSTEAIEIYVAEGLTHVGAKLDDGEFLDVGSMSVDEMLAAIDRGEITDAKTVTALLLYVRRMDRRAMIARRIDGARPRPGCGLSRRDGRRRPTRAASPAGCAIVVDGTVEVARPG